MDNFVNNFIDFISKDIIVISHNKAYLDLLILISNPFSDNLNIDTSLVLQQINQNSQLFDMYLKLAREDLGERPNPQSDTLSYQISMLYRIYISHVIFQNFSLVQLNKILPIETHSRTETLEILEKIQSLLDQIEPETMLEIYDSIQMGQEDRTAVIQSKIQIQHEYFYLFNVLSNIMTLERNDIQTLHSQFPKFEPLALVLLTNLSKYALGDAITTLEQMNSFEELERYSNVQEMNKISLSPQNKSNINSDLSLDIEIIEQPPDKCVYKRNIKPAPTVRVVGSYNGNDLYIVPILIRCDTREELPLLNSNPIKVVPTKPYSFKKLKITQTSHQLNETLFSIRFELRLSSEGRPTTNYQVIHSVTTNPICVLSHSTQLKSTGYSLPTVSEVVPPNGPPYTRVAILGANFFDSPTIRVKFGDVEVVPIVHGEKTLICTAPKHISGLVRVSVCNDVNVWSNQNAEFIFEDEAHIGLSESSLYLSESGGYYGKAEFEEGIETLGSFD